MRKFAAILLALFCLNAGAHFILQFMGDKGQSSVVSGLIDSPDDIQGLIRWYKADSYVGLMDGASVGVPVTSPWVDSTGSGNNPSSAGTDAIWHDGTTYGSPYVHIDNSSLGGVSSGNLGDLTIVFAGKKTANDCFILTNPDQLRLDFGGDLAFLFYDGTGGGQASDAVTATTFSVFVCQRSGTTVSFKTNTVDRGSFTYSSANFTVGTLGSGGGTHIHQGELLIYNTVATDTQLANLYTNYFKPRFTVLP